MRSALGIAGGREAQTGPFPMGTKAPSETKELRVVACDSLSDERGTRLSPGAGEEAYLRLTLIWARAGFGQLWGDHVEGMSAPFKGAECSVDGRVLCRGFLQGGRRILGRITPSLNLKIDAI